MERYEFLIALFSIMSGTGVVITLAYMYFRRPQSGPGALPPSVDARLARIEQAVDSIAVEVERISEAQRFTARLMAEGQRPAAVAAHASPEGRARG